MSLAFQSGESIKQALYEELHNILNPDKVIRMGAEGRIKQLEFTEGKFFIAISFNFVSCFFFWFCKVMASIWPSL